MSDLQIDDGGLGLDLDKRDYFPFVHSGTTFGGFRPSFRRLEKGVPEGPGAALAGAEVVECAVAFFGIEEDAIVVGLFSQSAANADLASVDFFEFVEGDLEVIGDGLHLLFVDPNVAGGTGGELTQIWWARVDC
jgi:hypothetical protein